MQEDFEMLALAVISEIPSMPSRCQQSGKALPGLVPATSAAGSGRRDLQSQWLRGHETKSVGTALKESDMRFIGMLTPENER